MTPVWLCSVVFIDGRIWSARMVVSDGGLPTLSRTGDHLLLQLLILERPGDEELE